VLEAAFSPDGGRVAWHCWHPSTRSSTVSIWDLATGEQVLTVKVPDNFSRMAFRSDGQRLATGAWYAENVAVWDVGTGLRGEIAAPLVSLKHQSSDVTFSPDGTRLVTADENGTVKICEAATGALLHTRKGHRARVNRVAFSPDGKWLATAGRDGTIKIWDATAGPASDLAYPQLSLRGSGKPRGEQWVTFSPNGQRLATTTPDAVLLWEPSTGLQVLTISWRNGVECGAFSPDSRRLALTSSAGVDLRDVVTGQLYQQVHPKKPSHIQGVALGPDGQRLATVAGAQVNVWGIRQDQGQVNVPLLTMTHDKGGARGVAFSPDGRRLASGSVVTVMIWDVSQGQGEATAPLLTIKSGSYYSVAFSPDGQRLATASSNGTVSIWDIATARGEMSTPSLTLLGHTAEVFWVAFSPDGQRLASASRDRAVKIWETTTGQELLSLQGGMWGVAFSPDGQRLAGAGADGNVSVWEATVPTLELQRQRQGARLIDDLLGKFGR
jgi:WD40 repeat protein